MSALTNTLAAIPWWVWISLPTLLIGAVTYLITRNRRFSVRLASLILIVTLITFLFHSWELFLSNHFLGAFDRLGLPTNFSRTGWGLLIDAWPLWTGPVVIVSGLFTAALLIKRYRHTPVKTLIGAAPPEPKLSGSPEQVRDKLEIEKLKHRLAVSEETCAQLKAQVRTQPPSSKQFETKIETLREELKARTKEIKALQQQLETTQTDLTRANELVDKLLDERFKE